MLLLAPRYALVKQGAITFFFASYRRLERDLPAVAALGLFCQIHVDSLPVVLASKVQTQIDFFRRNHNFFVAGEDFDYLKREFLLVRDAFFHEESARKLEWLVNRYVLDVRLALGAVHTVIFSHYCILRAALKLDS